jgi:hypothetical protein
MLLINSVFVCACHRTKRIGIKYGQDRWIISNSVVAMVRSESYSLGLWCILTTESQLTFTSNPKALSYNLITIQITYIFFLLLCDLCLQVWYLTNLTSWLPHSCNGRNLHFKSEHPQGENSILSLWCITVTTKTMSSTEVTRVKVWSEIRWSLNCVNLCDSSPLWWRQ